MCDIGQANSLPCSESEQSVSEANWLSESSVARLAAWVSVRKCLESVEPSLDSDGFSAGWGDGEDGSTGLGGTEVRIGAGQCLFIPRAWWHAVLSESDSTSVVGRCEV